MRTKIQLATVFLTGLCVGSISYKLVKHSYNSRLIAEQNSQQHLERYDRWIKEKNLVISGKQKEELLPELHVISINRGFKINGDRSNLGRASIKVDRPGKKVVLFLNTYSPVLWQINTTEGTEIEKIILSGNQKQKLAEINNNILVENAYYGSSRNRYLRVPQSIYANNFPIFVRQINQNTGLEISSFQGANIANFDRPFQVDRLQNKQILSSNYPQISHPCSLPKTSFKGLYRVDNAISFGDYSLTNGPNLNDFIPVNVSQITYSPTNNKYYGIQNGRYLVEIDLNTKTTRQILMPNRDRKRSYLNGITFDTKRNRLLVYDRSNRGNLYSYSLNTREWNRINLNGNAFTSIVYHLKDDSIYALKANHNQNRDRNYLTLYKLNSNGAVIDIINFSDTALAGLPNYYNGYTTQLISSGKDLVMVWANKNSHSQNYNISSIEPRIYLIDPVTRRVKLTWKDTAQFKSINR